MRKNSRYIDVRYYKLAYMAAILASIISALLLLDDVSDSVAKANEFISPLPDNVEIIEVPKFVEVEGKPHYGDCDSEQCDIFRYIVEKFKDDAANAITLIRKCENSKFDPEATNWNRNGTWDRGIFQINEVHGYSYEEMGNWQKNIDAAYKIYVNADYKFTPWSCAEVINQRPFYK